MLQTIESNKWHCLCQNRIQIWNPWGQKHMNRAFTHDPTTFSYEVMTKSNIGWRPYWILRLWRPQWAPALAPSKNEFSMFWSTSVWNVMLVDKCAQYHPNCSLSSSTITQIDWATKWINQISTSFSQLLIFYSWAVESVITLSIFAVT